MLINCWAWLVDANWPQKYTEDILNVTTITKFAQNCSMVSACIT